MFIQELPLRGELIHQLEFNFVADEDADNFPVAVEFSYQGVEFRLWRPSQWFVLGKKGEETVHVLYPHESVEEEERGFLAYIGRFSQEVEKPKFFTLFVSDGTPGKDEKFESVMDEYRGLCGQFALFCDLSPQAGFEVFDVLNSDDWHRLPDAWYKQWKLEMVALYGLRFHQFLEGCKCIMANAGTKVENIK